MEANSLSDVRARRRFLAASAGVGALALLPRAVSGMEPLRVAFINPGKKSEAYWLAASESMQAAAQSLGVPLEIIYLERDHLRHIAVARELAARDAAKRPSHAVYSNDKRMAREMLKILDAANIKSFLAFSTMLAEDRAEFGVPRQKYKSWLGALVPRAYDAGYLTATALIKRGLTEKRFASNRRLQLIALPGDRSTESSILRNRGMERAVKEHPDVELVQTVYADWRRDLGREKARELYVRYPQAQLVWAGNDLMAFGAMEALEAIGGVPGKSKLFSGVNTSTEAMDAVISGRLDALAGGHFIVGAWAVVMLYDLANGRDFADQGLESEHRMFTLFDAPLARQYLGRFAQNAGGNPPIDFRRFSRAHNPTLKRYDFNFAQLLEPADPAAARRDAKI